MQYSDQCLDDCKLSCCNVKSINIWCEACECLLCTVWSERALVYIVRRCDTTNRMRVLILTVSTSYSFFSASLICLLLDLTSTMKTRVLFSSIIFIALSVLSGWIMIFPASRRGCETIARRGYRGARESVRVFGRWKLVLFRTLRTLCELTCENRPSE